MTDNEYFRDARQKLNHSPKYVQAWVDDRDGRAYYYFRRSPRKVRARNACDAASSNASAPRRAVHAVRRGALTQMRAFGILVK
jgi:hypothetical protein